MIRIAPAARAAMLEHARRELPFEACGIVLLGGGGHVTGYVPARNQANGPNRFLLEWPELPPALGYGLFHSHVAQPPRPSRHDRQSIGAWVGELYLIGSVPTWELRAFRVWPERALTVPILPG